jgi:hypothetical protein
MVHGCPGNGDDLQGPGPSADHGLTAQGSLPSAGGLRPLALCTATDHLRPRSTGYPGRSRNARLYMDAILVAPAPVTHADHRHGSALSWAAIVGGAFVIASMSTLLLSLGAGLGVSALSPWPGAGASATTVGAVAILWLVLTQVLSGALGGYLAGRMRSRWIGTHDDEVYFRDTAHGFLAWAVAAVATAAFLAATVTAMTGNEVQAPRGAGATASASSNPNGYYVDMLFRSAWASGMSVDSSAGLGAMAGVAAPTARDEAQRIFARGLVDRGLTPADSSYLSREVVAVTGLGQADAATRVSTTFATDQRAADAARKATAYALLWGFVALLAGAFFASLAATIGGRQRDNVVLI